MTTWDPATDRRNGDKKIAVLEERLANFMDTTTEFREELNTKLDKILDKLSILPCKERIGLFDGMTKQVNFMWLVLSILLISLIASAAKSNFDKEAILRELGTMKYSK